jgi:hypothetical protein
MMNCDMNTVLKPTKTNQKPILAFTLVVHLAGHLRPPVEQAAEEGDDRAAHHDVVEVRDDEVRVRQVHVDAQRAEEEARQAADGEEEDEGHRVEHRRRAQTIDPLYMVAVQLKTFTPLGMATRNVSAEKTIVANSLMPATKRW